MDIEETFKELVALLRDLNKTLKAIDNKLGTMDDLDIWAPPEEDTVQ